MASLGHNTGAVCRAVARHTGPSMVWGCTVRTVMGQSATVRKPVLPMEESGVLEVRAALR
jgi:hypothetical protein